MKTFFTLLVMCISVHVAGQFVPQPLNYPAPGYWPYYYSITDPDHVWVGTINENNIPCPFSVKTTDGGNSWITDSIPVPGSPSCVSICGWDSNTCFFVFYDVSGVNGPSIWKTSNGGTTWSDIISDQFTDGFINFYHAFTADTGIAVGDPRNGYFEVQCTFDGGTTWTRVPSSAMPEPLPGEMGLNNSYSAVGNSIWFTTSKSRCYHSSDRGLTWEVSDVFPGNPMDLGVCFSSENSGAVWCRGTNTVVVTHDAGITWDTVPFPQGWMIQDMSRVSGFGEGFVVTAYKTAMNVYFTPDMFSTLDIIQAGLLSNGAVEFYDSATGWLGGNESGYNEIFKYQGVLTSVKENKESEGNLIIMPNPASDEVIIKLPRAVSNSTQELIMTDLTGKIILQKSIKNSGQIIVDVSGMNEGVYLLKLISGKNLEGCSRLIIKK